MRVELGDHVDGTSRFVSACLRMEGRSDIGEKQSV
jgi:hypothetical protein